MIEGSGSQGLFLFLLIDLIQQRRKLQFHEEPSGSVILSEQSESKDLWAAFPLQRIDYPVDSSTPHGAAVLRSE